MKWEGVMPAVTTKFTNDDQLDFKMFDVNIQAQIDEIGRASCRERV